MRALGFLFVVLMVVACSKATPNPPTAASDGAAASSGNPKQAAEDLFKTRCTPCHGAEGKGDGSASAGLNPKPRNFGDAAWQTSVDDAHIQKIIQFGGSAVGKSPAMPANPDLGGKPEVIAALKDKIRSFNGK